MGKMSDYTATDYSRVLKPSVTSPSDGATGVVLSPDLEGSTYYSLYGKDHQASQFQVSETSDFATTVVDKTTSGVTTYSLEKTLDTLTTYYWRVRYQDIDGIWSEWSEYASFETADIYIDTPSITSPTDGATDQSLTPTINGDTFNCVNGSDTHESSDWQVYSDSGLTSLIWEAVDDTTNLESIDVPDGNLNSGTTYYVRVRYTGETYGDSDWSSANEFTTDEVAQPSITSPNDGATGVSLTADLVGDAFSVGSSDTHDKSDWEVATDDSFSSITFSSYDDTSNLESITMSGLDTDTLYYARTRYHGNEFGWSDWSETISFTTADIYIQTPTNQSPSDGTTDIGETPTLSADAFSCVNGSDTHASSDWEVYSDSGLTTLVWSSYDDASNLESIQVPAGNLSTGTTYYWRCRYTGTTYGDSDWSTETSFDTASTFCPHSLSNEGPGPGCDMLNYDDTTDTGYYGYVGCGNEPTYDSSTTYSSGDIVNDGSNEFYYSKTDSNSGNALPSVGGENTNWKWIGSGILTDGPTVSSGIGLSAGTAFNSDCGWLKYFIGANAATPMSTRHGTVTAEDRVVFISRKTIRNDLSWDDIYNAGAVYGTGDNGTANSASGDTTQNAQITVDSNDYIVRLMTGCQGDPASEAYNNQQCSDDEGGGSEWSDLLYRVHTDVPDCGNPTIGMPGGNETTRHGGPQDGANWANFTNAELQVHRADAGDGTFCWCQEQGNNTSRRVVRGYDGVANFSTGTADLTYANFGWRPVLELIQS